jgi:gluconate 2-dehydrogenase gamma chain
MNRRDNLKLILTGGIATTLLVNESCKKEDTKITNKELGKYGRTEDELKHDEKVLSDVFFTKEELAIVTLLADIIIPKDEVSGSASEAGVPDFIEFMMKDQPDQQLPMRGGLKWLDNKCLSIYNKVFSECTSQQRIEIIDQIAYPEKATLEMKPGVKFFNLMRNFVATGFYTSKIGVADMGYKGNVPNEWDGVPDEVLKKHGLAYEEKYLDLYIKPQERNDVMKWKD